MKAAGSRVCVPVSSRGHARQLQRTAGHCIGSSAENQLPITNYQLPDGPVKAGRRWGQRHPQGANLGSNGRLKFLSKLKQSAATSPP